MAFKSTTVHGNVDALSWPPPPVQPSSMPMPTDIVCLITYPCHCSSEPEVDKHRSTAVKRSAICRESLPKWASKASMSPFWTFRGELTTHEECILWGSRVVALLAGCKQLLQELHAIHQGTAKMKRLPPSFW